VGLVFCIAYNKYLNERPAETQPDASHRPEVTQAADQNCCPDRPGARVVAEPTSFLACG